MSFPYKRILCAVDFDENCAAAIKEAHALAQAGDAKLLLLHVVWINPLATEGYVLAELEESQAKEARRKLSEAAQRALEGAGYEIEICVGDPGEGILAAAQRCDADLVVMATHGRRGVSRLLLGSVAARVVSAAASPVLLVRHRA